MFIKKIKIDIELVHIRGACCCDEHMCCYFMAEEGKIYIETKCMECDYSIKWPIEDFEHYGVKPKVLKLTDLTIGDIESIYESENLFGD